MLADLLIECTVPEDEPIREEGEALIEQIPDSPKDSVGASALIISIQYGHVLLSHLLMRYSAHARARTWCMCECIYVCVHVYMCMCPQQKGK